MNISAQLTSLTSRTRTWRALPPQKVSSKVKDTQEWRESNIDAIIGMSQARGDNGRSPRYNKQVNYDLVNSRFKESDFEHVLNPYGITDAKYLQYASKMQNYNILRPKIETLKGEEMKLGMTFRAVATNGEAVLQKNKERQSAVTAAIMQRAMAMASGDINPETGQPNAPDPAAIGASFRTEYASPTEIASNQLLKFLVKNDLLQMKFSKGWEHALITAEEIYYVGINDGHPSVRVCNPLNVSFDREVENPFIHKSDWAMEERWMPAGSVMDLYGDYMSDELVQMIDNGELGGTSVMSNGMSRDFAYDFNGGMRIDQGMIQNTSHIYVAHCTWKSFKKEGKLTAINERTGTMESVIVDDKFVLTPEMARAGAQLQWYWTTEIWEGTRIGHKSYINIHPLDNQTKNLPYVGYIYNNVNSIATSLVDMVKPHQYTYIIIWWRLEQEIAKAKGKKFVMDIAQLPKSQGWTMDQWMYYFDNLGVAWINSKEEGRQGDDQSVAKFNQFAAIDMSLSNVVSQYMQILAKLEEQVDSITGVSKQREGAIGASETATGAQRAIIQSTNNTKPLFFYHDLVRQTVLQELLEKCKVAYADGTQIEYAVDEKTVETIKIDRGMLNGTDLGVFVSDSYEDAENLQKLEQYLQVALQQDKANLSDVIAILGTKSLSLIMDTIVGGERDKAARDQQSAQAAQEAQAALQRELLADKQYDRDATRESDLLKSETAIEVALINADAKSEDPGVQSQLAERKLALEERKQAHSESKSLVEANLKGAQLEETKRSNKAKEVITKNKSNASKS
jgi:hypothetical protein